VRRSRTDWAYHLFPIEPEMYEVSARLQSDRGWLVVAGARGGVVQYSAALLIWLAVC
jgi:hypothetical protein